MNKIRLLDYPVSVCDKCSCSDYKVMDRTKTGWEEIKCPECGAHWIQPPGNYSRIENKGISLPQDQRSK